MFNNVVNYFAEFPNLYVHHLNYTNILYNSPQAHIMDKIKDRKTVNLHISDLIRVIILSMHGGAYMDSDTVSLKPWPSDIKNFLVEGTL